MAASSISLIEASLSPSRGERNVSVFRNVEFLILSTGEELDLTTLVFKINDYELRPSSFYTGSTKKEIKVIFYAISLIKYNTVRYKQTPEVRYGNASDKMSNFLYDHSYKVQIEIKDIEETLFSDYYTFYTEIGLQVNSSESVNILLPNCLQQLGNYFPAWAKARMDTYSNFQQFITPIGESLDQIDMYLAKGDHNYYLSTADKKELSTLYSISLGSDFQFESMTVERGRTLLIPPKVTTYSQHHKYEILSERSNSLGDFFYDKKPKSVIAVKESGPPNLLFTGTITDLINVYNKRLIPATGWYIEITGTGLFSKLSLERKTLTVLTCRIEGYSPFKKKQSEDILIPGAGWYRTTKLWGKIDSVSFYNLQDDLNANFSFYYYKIGEAYFPNILRFHDTDRRAATSTWKLKQGSSGSILSHEIYQGNGVEILSTKAQMIVAEEFEILDIDNTTLLTLIDIETSKFEDYIYGIDNDYFYFFSRKNFYPSVIKELPASPAELQMAIVMDEEIGVRENGEKIFRFHSQQIALNKKIIRYRFRIMYPDKSVYYIKSDGTLLPPSQKNEATVAVEPTFLLIKTKEIEIALPYLGDYILMLDVLTSDSQISTDSRILRVPFRSALFKFKLERIKKSETLQGLYMDFDSELKMTDTKDNIYTLTFNKENMLIDYNNKKIFFNEQYDRAIVDV